MGYGIGRGSSTFQGIYSAAAARRAPVKATGGPLGSLAQRLSGFLALPKPDRGRNRPAQAPGGGGASPYAKRLSGWFALPAGTGTKKAAVAAPARTKSGGGGGGGVGNVLRSTAPTPGNIGRAASKTPEGFLAGKLFGGGIDKSKHTFFNPVAGTMQTMNLRGNPNKQRPLPGVNRPLTKADFAGMDRSTRISRFRALRTYRRTGSAPSQ